MKGYEFYCYDESGGLCRIGIMPVRRRPIGQSIMSWAREVSGDAPGLFFIEIVIDKNGEIFHPNGLLRGIIQAGTGKA